MTIRAREFRESKWPGAPRPAPGASWFMLAARVCVAYPQPLKPESTNTGIAGDGFRPPLRFGLQCRA